MHASVPLTWPVESSQLVYKIHGEPSEVLDLEMRSISPPGEGEVLLDVLAVSVSAPPWPTTVSLHMTTRACERS